jgi:hypothetical protein
MNSFAKNSFAVTRQETIFGKKRRGIGLLMTHKRMINMKSSDLEQ